MPLLPAITTVILFFFLYVVLYIFVLPFLVLLHELAHAIVALMVTTDNVTIILGDGSRWKHAIGRVTISASPFSGWVGFCRYEGQMTPSQSAMTSLAGPAASLLVCLSAVAVLTSADEWAAFVLWGVVFGTATSFLVTIIPIRYPSWMGAYAGMASDGHRVVQSLRE